MAKHPGGAKPLYEKSMTFIMRTPLPDGHLALLDWAADALDTDRAKIMRALMEEYLMEWVAKERKVP